MPKKRPHRPTSKEAHESVKAHKQAIYDKIMAGMAKLKVGGTAEQISKVCGLRHDQVWKRLPEMIEMGLIYNDGTTRTTSTGRKSMVRQIVGLKTVDVSNPKTDSEKIITKQLLLL